MRGPAAVAATLCFYVAWRISAKPQLIWLAAVSAAIAVQAVLQSGLQLTDISHEYGGSLWLALFDVVSLALIAQLSVAAGRRSHCGDPIMLGVLVGLGLGIGRILAVIFLPRVDANVLGWPVLVLGFLLLAVPVTLLLTLLPDVPAWVSARMGAGVLLYGMGHLASYIDGSDRSTVGSVVTLVAGLNGALFLAAAAAAMLRMAIVEEDRDRDRLRLRVDELENGLRIDRARIHEINSTIAGVVSASRLLREDPTIGSERRALLDNMVHAELGRLQRLLNEPVVSGPGVVDLDDTIGNLVLAQEARGNRVSWLPSGARVSAEPDAVAEVLNILLDNAAKHGCSDTSVTVTSVADAIEVVVSDDGPGIEPEVRQHLFEWGARGARSRGQGIGLHIARDLTARHGGYLRLGEGTARGATFVAGFPMARRGEDEPAHLA
ncbi:HAMP domain-containing sensor histidine kinase [Nocardioides sp. BP30]|uniref:sensor histidine kinase n=1 Tax=Nocardioides sp. BP30 TaxID=3036374 RepID=UPI00246894A8|nr:HAMP domain-containing sensor histidine kinase [Nocardioides sp. BP30]WGL51776.1 HAMP domain-containing sensor histidine kinase [Nocardioides sp. BP30]